MLRTAPPSLDLGCLNSCWCSSWTLSLGDPVAQVRRAASIESYLIMSEELGPSLQEGFACLGQTSWACSIASYPFFLGSCICWTRHPSSLYSTAFFLCLRFPLASGYFRSCCLKATWTASCWAPLLAFTELFTSCCRWTNLDRRHHLPQSSVRGPLWLLLQGLF